MPQHDFVLDNAPGLAVRQDMNAAVQALASVSSGPVEPTTKIPGMLWLDTSVSPNGVVRQRNLANDAWIAFRGSTTTPGEDIHAAPEKLVPVGADEIPISDSASTPTPWQRAKIKISTLIAAVYGGIVGLTAKTTLADADNFVITDSAAANAAKKITWANIKTVLNAVYALAVHTHTTAQVTGLDAALADKVSKSVDSLIGTAAFILQTDAAEAIVSNAYTPAVTGKGNMRYVQNQAAAWTFNAPPATSGQMFTMVVCIYNNTNPLNAAPTFAGFQKVSGDAVNTAYTKHTICYITRMAGLTTIHVDAMP